jgi:hypothetical protein
MTEKYMFVRSYIIIVIEVDIDFWILTFGYSLLTPRCDHEGVFNFKMLELYRSSLARR